MKRGEYVVKGVEGNSKEKENVAGVERTEWRYTDEARKSIQLLASFLERREPRAVSMCLF